MQHPCDVTELRKFCVHKRPSQDNDKKKMNAETVTQNGEWWGGGGVILLGLAQLA